MIPAGVHDTKPGCPIQSAPTLCGWKPSTSFFGEIARIIADLYDRKCYRNALRLQRSDLFLHFILDLFGNCFTIYDIHSDPPFHVYFDEFAYT